MKFDRYRDSFHFGLNYDPEYVRDLLVSVFNLFWTTLLYIVTVLFDCPDYIQSFILGFVVFSILSSFISSQILFSDYLKRYKACKREYLMEQAKNGIVDDFLVK